MSIEKQIHIRLYVTLCLLGLLAVAVLGRVVHLHWAEGAELRVVGEQQASTWIDIPAMRGRILDRAGRTLAANIVRYDLAVDPTVDGFAERRDLFFERLSDLTRPSAAQYRAKVRNRSSRQYVRLVQGLTESQRVAIEALEVPGVILEPRVARRYNYGTTAAHVLGYVNSDGQGLAGLELQYEDWLRGTEGRQRVRRDRLRTLKAEVGGAVTEPEHGETLVLTLDLVLQTIAEEELQRGLAETNARWGTVIAMDPRTGEVLAMANAPTYDPNRPGAFPVPARRNRAITDRIEPGSTFKLVASAAVVEQNLVALDDTIDTGDGWMVVGGWTIKDTHAYGRIPFEEVIALSSNVGMAKAVDGLDEGLFYQYARNLGFGQPTWIDLPGEVEGTLKRPEGWSRTTKAAMSRGYEIDASPLQVLAAYAALANGGLLVQPYLVAERRDVTDRTVWRARQDSVRRAFRAATAEMLMPAFEETVETGTATAAHVEGLRIAGKTGTARKAQGGRYGGAHRASFAGLFPVEAPSVAMLVVIDEPRSSEYASVVAAPIFQRIAQRWASVMPEVAAYVDVNAADSPADQVLAAHTPSVPDVVGRPAPVAAKTIYRAGYRVAGVDGEASYDAEVHLQKPTPGEAVALAKRVHLQAGEEAEAEAAEPTMPDLTGLSAREARAWMASLGVAVRVEGRGRVQRQSVSPGAELPNQLTIHCN